MGRQTFAQFEDVIRLRRIHRILGKDPYKETTMRLRDAAITLEDYMLWKSHEIESLEPDDDSSEPLWQDAENLLRDALVLVTDNAQAGRINGRRLAAGVPLLSAPSPADVSSIVVRCEASHNDGRGERFKADEFRNVRKAVHLRVGARVILITNNIWGVNTVPLGLMNGARGVVVAIVYASSGIQRVDGNALATTGWPSSDGSSFPRGLHCCPLPDYVVVHFPTYKGSALLSHDLPSTWVPIPTVEVRGTSRKSCCRVGLPLRLAWSLTIHKSQGLTCQEGTVVSFKDSKMPRAVSKLGLAFVGWTRATSWSKVAFQSLPPLEEFLAVRMTKDFQMREVFETQADALHDAFFYRRGITEKAQFEGHSDHLHATLQRTEAREATADELRDLEVMLQQHGVAPVSDSVMRWGQERVGRKGGGGLWSIVSSFRADKAAKDIGDKKRSKQQKSSQDMNDLPATWTKALLTEHGYDDQLIEEAMKRYGNSVPRCVEFCLKKGIGPTDLSEDALPAMNAVDEEAWAFDLIHELGFDSDTVTKALEATDFSVQEALNLLLNGNDPSRNKYCGAKHFRRHTNRKTMNLNLKKVARDEVRQQYLARAQNHFAGRLVSVLDFGMYAGETVNACFWLALAAGLAKSAWHINTQALPGLANSVELLQQVRAMPLQPLDRSQQVRLSPLGLLAERLRCYMCAGATAVMLRPAVQARLFPAFAAIDTTSDSRQLQDYKRWVARLADKEFADELVVLAVVLEFKIRIVTIPFTPTDSASQWKICTYGDQQDNIQVVLANNDVHFMWIDMQ